MSTIGFRQIADGPYAQPGHFNDPDMLVVGKVGWGDNQRNSRLTPDEQYTHISLWSLLSSPLLIGCDMGKLDKFTLNLLTTMKFWLLTRMPWAKKQRGRKNGRLSNMDKGFGRWRQSGWYVLIHPINIKPSPLTVMKTG